MTKLHTLLMALAAMFGISSPASAWSVIYPGPPVDNFEIITETPLINRVGAPLGTFPWGAPEVDNLPELAIGTSGFLEDAFFNSWSGVPGDFDRLIFIAPAELGYFTIYDAYWTINDRRSLEPVFFVFGARGAPVPFIKGMVVSLAPEPNAWIIMIVGFGAIGFALRRNAAPRLRLGDYADAALNSSR